MKTFLLDLHGGLAGFGPAAPLLYPLRETGELQLVGGRNPASSQRDLAALTDSVRIELIREFRAHWLALFLVDLAPVGGGQAAGLAEQLDGIRERFLEPLKDRGLAPARALVVALDTLAREPHTGAPLDSAARELWSDDLRRLAPPQAAGLRELSVIRFPLRRAPEPLFQQDLIRLAYLLVGLIEIMNGEEPLPRGQLYQAQEVALNAAEVARWMDGYIACLQVAERTVAHRLEHPEPMTLQLVRDPHCTCGQALSVLELSAPEFGRFRKREDLSLWQGWGQRTGSALAGREREGEEVLRRCVDERRTRAPRPVAETVPSLEEEADRLRERLRAARRALLQESALSDDGWDWADELRRQTPLLTTRIEARPQVGAFVIFLAALLLLLLPAALLTVPGTGASRLLPPALLLFGGSLVATGLALRRLRQNLADATDAALKSARRIASRIGERVEQQRRHIELLCEAEAARYNDTQARAALAARSREVLLFRYHRDALEHHLRLAHGMRSFEAVDAGGRSAPAADARETTRQPLRDWPLDRPPHRHPLYAPARCSGTRTESTHELHLGVRQLSWTSDLTPGLRRVRLVEDPIYPRHFDAGAQGGGKREEEREDR